jgi:hypothetical protein
MFVFVELGEFFVVIGGQLCQHLDIFSSLDCPVFGGGAGMNLLLMGDLFLKLVFSM